MVMNYRDRWEENEQGERFVFTVEMQRRLAEAGLPIEPASLSRLGSRPAPPPRREQASYERESGRERESRGEPQQQQREREREVTGPSTIQIDPMTGKYIGAVKWYNAKKGYGFIVRGAGEEIFFHRSSSVGEIEFEEGQWVLYDVEERDKGPEASDVELYEGEIPA
jgi:CspA family cold shock protein